MITVQHWIDYFERTRKVKLTRGVKLQSLRLSQADRNLVKAYARREPDEPLLTRTEAARLGLETIIEQQVYDRFTGRHRYDREAWTHPLGDEHVLKLVCGDVSTEQEDTAQRTADRQSARMAHSGRRRDV